MVSSTIIIILVFTIPLKILDHIALVLRLGGEDDEVYYIHSVGNLGVSLQSYSNIKPLIGNFYKKIVLRKLNFVRTAAQLRTFEKFINQTRGNEY